MKPENSMKNTFISSLILVASLFLSPALIAHDTEDHTALDISEVWARKTGSRTASAAVYFNLQNGTDAPETLLAVSSPRAAMATIHRSFEQDGIMRMEMQDELEVAPGSTAAFAPGGMHIMLMRLDQPLKQGEVFPLTLTFKNAGEVTIYVEVTGIGGPQK